MVCSRDEDHDSRDKAALRRGASGASSRYTMLGGKARRALAISTPPLTRTAVHSLEDLLSCAGKGLHKGSSPKFSIFQMSPLDLRHSVALVLECSRMLPNVALVLECSRMLPNVLDSAPSTAWRAPSWRRSQLCSAGLSQSHGLQTRALVSSMLPPLSAVHSQRRPSR
jgi:hypothetical protein